MVYPKKVLNFINNKEIAPHSGKFFTKINPANGKVLGQIARSAKQDASLAIESATRAFGGWSQTPVVERSVLLREATMLIQKRRKEIAEIVHLECAKSI